MSELIQLTTDTPIGEMIAIFADKHLVMLDYSDCDSLITDIVKIEKHYANTPRIHHNHETDQLRRQLDQYFNGSRRRFTIPTAPIGTIFQQQVWKTLLTVPYGSTISYAEQSKRLGNPKAIRAMAAANGKNPISIIIPCHRIIGSDGSLTGYAGGIERKRYLIELEQPSFEVEFYELPR